ncbi:hypothetical protein B566_EDAN011886 [Ephemera danica]|nr:hypothetical protein B566_EDAN011886 [Ephemera danica]
MEVPDEAPSLLALVPGVDGLDVTRLDTLDPLAVPASATHKRKQVLYDANGINLETGKDACDCLVPNCAGCHFPCPRCRSLKCGHECRQHRRAQYEPGIISEKMNWTKQVESVEDDDDDVTAIN